MRSFLTPILGLFFFLAACASEPRTGPDAGVGLLEEVAAAMGGWETLESIEREEIQTRGAAWEPHQAPFPGGVLEIASFDQNIRIDYSGPSMRLEFNGERSYPLPGPVGFVEVIDGNVGALLEPLSPENDEPTGGTETDEDAPAGERMQGSRVAARLRDIRRMPARIALVARESEELTRALDRSVDGTTYQVLEYHDGMNPVELLVSPTSKLPVRVIVLETDPLYGDTHNELIFDDWRPTRLDAARTGGAAEVPIPYRRTVYLNGDRLREEEVQEVALNPVFDAGVFDIPAPVRNSPEPGDRVTSDATIRRAIMGFGPLPGFGELPEVASLESVAPGVWLAGGGSHNSLIIEMNDHLIVAGTPLFNERSIGVIEALNVRFPEKPVRYAIVSHFHGDHSGGVRAYAGLGARIVAHESIAPFLEVVLSRPRTIRPDALSRLDQAATIQRVGEYFEITDGARTVEVRHVPNEHANGMLMTYVPEERVVFVSDLYSPPNPVDASDANARAFFDAIVESNLDVETIVGAHGSTGPFSVLAQIMGARDTAPNGADDASVRE